MQVRVALTLFIALVVALLAAPVGAQAPTPDPAVDHGLHVGRPRAAVLSVFDAAAESFLRFEQGDENTPIRLAPGRALHLTADYEAFLVSLTAGYAEFELAVWRIGDDGTDDRLGSDSARVIAFGPAKRAGALSVAPRLGPGLHHLGVGLVSRARAVGVADWTVDEATQDLWIFIPEVGEGAPEAADTVATLLAAPAPDQPEPAPEPGMPLGGLYVGSQRAAAGATAVGAENFDAGHDATIVAVAGQPIRVWSDYELWWSDETAGEGRAALTVSRRPTSADASELLGKDVVEPVADPGPSLADGALVAEFTLEEPGVYHLVAVLQTRIRGADMVTDDESAVPFTVRVVGEPPRTGAIAGHVTAEDGGALEGVLLIAHGAQGLAGRAHSNANGGFKIEGLTPGTYYVQAVPGDLNYLGEWWNDSATRRGAWPVEVAAGRTTGGIDFALTPGATIAGKVMNRNGAPIAGVEITVGVFPPQGSVAPGDPRPLPPDGGNVWSRTRTNADGFYAIDSLPAGRYWVRARDPEGRYLTEYFDDAPTMDQADPVALSAGETRDDIHFELAGGGAIAGHVTASPTPADARALPGIVVEAIGPVGAVAGRAVTNREGAYRIGGLAAGAYLARASDPDGGYATEWFEEAATREEADEVVVEAGATTDGVDFTLEAKDEVGTLLVAPPVVGLRPGDETSLALSVADVRNLAAFEAELKWRPSVFEVLGVELTGYLGSTGREVVPVEPVVDNDEGVLRVGAASVGDVPGPSGAGVLVRIKIRALEAGETAVEITASTLTRPDATPIRHRRAHGRVHVGPCMRGDFDCNCIIDIADVMAVVVRWGAQEGDPDYAPEFDLDADGDIDIVDVQIEASLWGTTCDQEPGAGAQAEGMSADGASPGPVAMSPRSGDAAVLRPLGARLSLSASPAEPRAGDEVIVTVTGAELFDLAGFDLVLQYDPALLELQDASLGEMLTASARSYVALGPEVEDGEVRFGSYSFPGPPAPSGSGELARFRFAVTEAGAAALNIPRATTVSSLGEARSAQGDNLVVEAVGPTIGIFVPFAEDNG